MIHEPIDSAPDGDMGSGVNRPPALADYDLSLTDPVLAVDRHCVLNRDRGGGCAVLPPSIDTGMIARYARPLGNT